MTSATVVALLAVPVVVATAAGCVLLKRAFARPQLLPEEIALAAAWVFIVGGLVWLGVFLAESTLLGFGAPWSWLAAAHFGAAGFGALTVTALCCRVVSGRRALRILRILLVVHPVAYLVTAAGISGHRYCNEVGAASYELIFVTQLGAVLFGRSNRMASGPRILLVLALTVPVITLVPSLAWAWARPFLGLDEMVRYHGLVNAIGHVGLGLAALLWGRPPSHSVIQKEDLPAA
jgi:hypothetical protein